MTEVIVKLTGSDDWEVPAGVTELADVLLVAGGGGGGGRPPGGAGGVPTAPPVGPDAGPAPLPRPPQPPEDLGNVVRESAENTTVEVAGLRVDLVDLLNNQQTLTGDVAEALNNLASALQRSQSQSTVRNTRTRTEVT